MTKIDMQALEITLVKMDELLPSGGEWDRVRDCLDAIFSTVEDLKYEIEGPPCG